MKILPVASIGLGWKIYQKSGIQATLNLIFDITPIHQKMAVKLYTIIDEFQLFSPHSLPLSHHKKAPTFSASAMKDYCCMAIILNIV